MKNLCRQNLTTVALIIITLIIAPTPGCKTNPRAPATSAAKAVLPSGTTLSQAGSVEVPASVLTARSVAIIPLPKGSSIAVVLPSEKVEGKISVILTEPSSLSIDTHSEKAVMPQNFRPPAPISAIEQSTADGVKLFYWLSGGLILLTIGLAYTEHFKAAICSGIGAVLTPIFGRFVSEISGYTIALTATVAATVLYLAWHFVPGMKVRAISLVQTLTETGPLHTEQKSS